MKKLYLSLAALALTFSFVSCGGSGTSKTTGSTKSDTSAESATETPVQKGETYTGAAYDRKDYSEGNITVRIGDADISYDNEKVKLSYYVSIVNSSKTMQEISVSDVHLYSTNKDEFTSSCTTTLDGKELTDESVILYGSYSTKLRFSATFSDTNRDDTTEYYNTFTVKDSANNIYNVTVSYEEEHCFYEWKTVTLYDNSEYTADNGFKYGTTGSCAYKEDSYCVVSTEVLTITNTGNDTECLFNIGSMTLYSVSDDDYSLTFLNPSAKLNGSSFYSYHDMETFASGTVLELDLSGKYYGVSESDLPAETIFTFCDGNAKVNYKVVFLMTAQN